RIATNRTRARGAPDLRSLRAPLPARSKAPGEPKSAGGSHAHGLTFKGTSLSAARAPGLRPKAQSPGNPPRTAGGKGQSHANPRIGVPGAALQPKTKVPGGRHDRRGPVAPPRPGGAPLSAQSKAPGKPKGRRGL